MQSSQAESKAVSTLVLFINAVKRLLIPIKLSLITCELEAKMLSFLFPLEKIQVSPQPWSQFLGENIYFGIRKKRFETTWVISGKLLKDTEPQIYAWST